MQRRVVNGLRIAVLVVLLATSMFRIETWPLTAVPMYSINVPNGFGSTLEEARQTARRHLVGLVLCLHALRLSLRAQRFRPV